MSSSVTPRKSGTAPDLQGQPRSMPFTASPAANRFRSSLVPMSRPSPGRPAPFPTRVSASTSSGNSRDLFGTAKPSRVTPFAPKLPAAATKASPRKFAPAKSVSAGMANIASSELFKMRIPSPDPGLTGEALTKAVPDDLSRKGTVYADQYLADKCPPEFDELQRRQFFCILDLRRLKHAANAIFAKKEWKLNIMNFAKEYEKSRGLIMLRYGLYEFKNVKPSAELLKRWRAAHGLPEPDPEPQTTTPKPDGVGSATAGTGSTKRKADDDLQPKDNTLMASTANQNKKRNVEQSSAFDMPRFAPTPMKSKRKADEAEKPDENQRSKLQKPTSSAAKSKLESIIDNVQSGSSASSGSPLKRTLFGANSAASISTQTPLFGVSKLPGETPFASKSNPFKAATNGASAAPKLESSQFQPGKVLNGSDSGSVLSGHKFGSTPATGSANIFSYLSESSANNSGNENGDADAETDDESGHASEPEIGSQDVAPSYEPSAAASTGTSTPPTQGAPGLFAPGKTNNTDSISSAASKPPESATKGGLFDRVSMGSDGQPLRATPPAEEPRESSPTLETAAAVAEHAKSQQANTSAKSPVKPPGDYTFNPTTTPINFSQGGNSIFASKPAAEKPTTSDTKEIGTNGSSAASSIFASKTPAAVSAVTSQQTPKTLFGSLNQSSDTPKADATPTTSIFAGSRPIATPSSKFGAKKNATKPSSIFGASITQASTAGEPDTTTAKEQPKSIFGSQPPFGNSELTKDTTPATASTIFGGLKKTSEPDKALFNGSTLFSGLKKTGEPEKASSNGSTLFGGLEKRTEPEKTPSNGSTSVFGDYTKSSAPNTFGTPATPTPAAEAASLTKQSFGDQEGQPAKRPMFGVSKPDQPIDFAASNATSAQAPKPSFGATPSTLFGSTAAKPTAPAPASIFGNSTATASPFQFGSAAPTEKKPEEPAAPKFNGFGSAPPASTPIFSFGSQNNTPGPTESKPASSSLFTFGVDKNAPPTPTFGASNAQPGGSGSSKFDFNFTGGSAPAAGSSFTFGGDGQESSSNQGSFTFTAGGLGQSAPNPFSPSKGQSAPTFGGNSSTPTPSGSFNFQFGGQAPSMPSPAPAEQNKSVFGGQPNGSFTTPGFSFTSATPPQNTPNTFVSKPAGVFGNLLQAGTSTGASSPFPAPSSMNTTPVNGTPEPQTQQGYDDEAPQEQISLINGGPGEEDETILHEVRAKAIVYKAVKPDEDDADKKSPWRTQGIGPLRVLKNKTTGTVRILLRAEPRGHIALNKTILSDYTYKADAKTLKITAASDDGNSLETWLLQVKRPEMAAELAGVLEANKAANKK